ncbi:MAG: glutathione S-transferase family protein [Myxococcota bacterium]
MKLYTGPLSLFSAKVRIALDEKGLPYEPVSVDWNLQDRYLPHHPDVEALNPKGQVPVLVDGNTVVFDSTLIGEYLEERSPDPPLMPECLAERARCRRLEAFADEIVFPAAWDLIEEVFYAGPRGGGDAERAARARSELAARYGELDRELGDREFLCGRFSLADIAVFVMVQAATALGAAPAPGLARLGAWLERMRSRPAVRRDVDAMQSYAAECLAGDQRRAS